MPLLLEGIIDLIDFVSTRVVSKDSEKSWAWLILFQVCRTRMGSNICLPWKSRLKWQCLMQSRTGTPKERRGICKNSKCGTSSKFDLWYIVKFWFCSDAGRLAERMFGLSCCGHHACNCALCTCVPDQIVSIARERRSLKALSTQKRGNVPLSMLSLQSFRNRCVSACPGSDLASPCIVWSSMREGCGQSVGFWCAQRHNASSMF